MPLVADPGSLTAEVTTGVGSAVLPVPAVNALNDLFRAWTGFQTQTDYVLKRRLNRATAYRAHMRKAVNL